MLHPKKVGTLPVAGSDTEKQTNEIKIAIPLLDRIDIQGKTITADALLTQRTFAEYLVTLRKAHYHFTSKNNQKFLLEDITLFFNSTNREPDHSTCNDGKHGRIETRNIWVTTELNDYLDFPGVGQSFKIERIRYNKKTGKETKEIVYGITSKTPDLASAAEVLRDNRSHWVIESCHYIIDWNYDEDRSRISKGFGPENMTRLRKFAIGLIKSKGARNVAQAMRKLSFNVGSVLGCLNITGKNHSPSMHVGLA
ncbi:MAG: ISAs1 family transposase [Desulfocapsa sp.]|nr:ISAs1 family transposase [Desulfocapsa sp.]